MKSKVAICGMATTSRHLAPWDDDSFEIWGLNESYYGGHVGPDKKPFLKRADRWLQLHPAWDYFRPHKFNHLRHPQWLRNDPWTEEELAAKEGDELYKEFLSWGATREQRRRTDFPIYMLEKDDSIPGSTVYPIREILESYGENSDVAKWFTNSYAYMCALAIHLGFEEIHNYGFEMSSEEEYGNQRPCATFWNGIAIGKGIKVVEPPGCRLLGQHDVLYGYEKIPGITKMHLEIELNAHRKAALETAARLESVRGQKKEVEKQLGIAMKSNQQGRINRIRNELEELLNKEVTELILLNAQNAYKQAVEKHMKDLDGLPSPEQIKLIPLGGRIKIS
jgi:hypothetical protein